MLSFGFRDLKGQGPGVVVRHGDVPSIFFYFEVFGEQFGDVLCGGQARRLSGFGNFLMQVEADLCAEVLCGWHSVVLLSADCKASILERHGESYSPLPPRNRRQMKQM